MNKVISREYVEKNYIHKDVLREIVEDIIFVSERPVRNTTKKQVYKAFQQIYNSITTFRLLYKPHRRFDKNL